MNKDVVVRSYLKNVNSQENQQFLSLNFGYVMCKPRIQVMRSCLLQFPVSGLYILLCSLRWHQRFIASEIFGPFIVTLGKIVPLT